MYSVFVPTAPNFPLATELLQDLKGRISGRPSANRFCRQQKLDLLY
jgi:hypothetical protein